MEEYWRICMGISTTRNFPLRKSMENAAVFAANLRGLDADDFSDVFGGPPRTVLYRKFSGDFTPSASFYDEAFQPLDSSPSYSTKVGRSLPAFRIPARGEGLYKDILWLDNDLRRSSWELSESDSSSVLSWEEPIPLRPPARDDIRLSSFAPKFRLNSTTMAADQDQTKQQMPPFTSTISFDHENLWPENRNHIENSMKISSYYGLCKHASSPETISLESDSFRSIKILVDDSEFNSPPSPASLSFCREPEAETGVQCNPMPEYAEDDDEDEDEVTSSYVIEINSDFRQSSSEEAVSIDEAIAWAKQGYNTKKSDLREHEKDQTNACGSIHPPMDGPGPMLSPSEEKPTEGKERSEDEDVKHWSSGNENNVRMLLSTLHNILWPDGGWHMINLASLTESSQVKKAYQKARLCLHPDKLQQRGATLSQKYVAEKAFSILQDAWDAFISRDVFFDQSTMQGVLESFWEAWNKQGVHGLEGLRTVLKA
ncbi:hypothetical protein V6N11_006034 [Hibiscus sabdariffa]|uniref:J domain-containing protein n=1 Tax=Hibiscus sabdariffa TaxID=183260 RepID=A0ABR2RPM6_9ROSI